MESPTNYFKEHINNVKNIKKDILSKNQEIDTYKKQLYEIKAEKNNTNFRWYDLKSKANFNDEIKAKEKLIKAEVTKLEKELNDLEKLKTEATNKRNKLFLWAFITAIVIIIAIVIAICSINEKSRSKSHAVTEFVETTYNTEAIETTENITTTAEATTETTEATTERVTEKGKETAKETTEYATSRSQKIVYSSKTGSHYHNDGCRYANGSKMTIVAAEKKGLKPCAVCNP